MRPKYISNIITLGIILPGILVACKKNLAVDPPKTELISETVFDNDLTAKAVIAALYADMSSLSGTFGSITAWGGFTADESICYNTADYEQIYQNNILTTNGVISEIWGTYYEDIYKVNGIIEGLASSTKLTPALKIQLEGEAKFIRAFCHFYLVNLFGDAPYITTTDYRDNTKVFRTLSSEVYSKIIADLIDAENKLTSDYSYSNGERIRPNKWSAKALLSRVFLYNGDWANAEIQATAIINNSSEYYLINNLDSVFLKNSKETIWQLLPVSPGKNTNEGSTFILTTTPSYSSLSVDFMNAFEAGDNRRTNWTDSITVGSSTYYYPYKYKIQTGDDPFDEYSMVLRLAEQYLIRAEARARQDKITGPNSAESDINTIRTRGGLSNTTAITQTQMLDAIEKERRIELFSEWGHRWLDLKRTDKANSVLGSIKPNWIPTDVLFPIPQSEILVNPNMVQNPGY